MLLLFRTFNPIRDPMTLSPSQASKLDSLVRMLSTSNKNEALASIVCIEELQILCGGSVIGYD